MKAPIVNLADFTALDPFFRIIEQGLDGLVRPGHFFDLLAEDITVDYVVTVPGYPRRIESRVAVAELYCPYGTMIVLDRCFDLAVHHDAAKGVVVLEYASEGHVVGTGLGTPTGISPCSRSARARSRTGGTTSTRSLYSMRLAGRRADVPPAAPLCVTGSNGTQPGYHAKVRSTKCPQHGALPYDAWSATCDTLHAHTQVLGKLAAALAPPEPQLQHAALRLTARGWETLPLPAPDGSGALAVALACGPTRSSRSTATDEPNASRSRRTGRSRT